ncbi:nitronate monooxygenase [Caballeronia novacaledonica]|uniref:Nitronate monooxygenase n=1 Tax=Caballeronia novacaledonica TaxID=1544861 RepID=A0A2U3I108_9BURK|nr:nitronate monooxygenase family protein [Caballeronia novacaledonica]SPB13766.1 nitronate monooxygenase [Caballeronia novacaledonica]
MKTRITELLGVKYPIVEGGMQWVGRAELAAAVSNAGAFGMVTARTQPSPEALLREIARTRELTSLPFGVNLTLSLTAQDVSYDGWIDAIIESGVKVVETAGNKPHAVIDRLKTRGIKIIHKCTSVRHALSAEQAGVDVISIDAFEAAGHPGEDDVPGMILFPAARRKLKVPMLASGGIADGKSMAAALVLGADGVNLGTRFMLTQESPIHDNVKRKLLASSELDTTLIKRTLKRTARFFSNAVTDEIVALERRPGGATYHDLQHLLSGTRGNAALAAGDIDGGLICASQVIGLVDDIPTCENAVSSMVADCRASLRGLAHAFIE